jgi:hypothetical protein
MKEWNSEVLLHSIVYRSCGELAGRDTFNYLVSLLTTRLLASTDGYQPTTVTFAARKPLGSCSMSNSTF